MTGGIENMTCRQKELLLMQCMFRVNPEQRRKLMAEVPDAYNAWCGGNPVVEVARVSDGEVLS